MTAPVQILAASRMGDARGWFCEVLSDEWLAEHGISERFVQDNQSYSKAQFTLRGLHFQRPPHAQAKLVRCLRGRLWDVAVDIRAGSPTFGRWHAAELSADNGRQMYIAPGFAHGFLTLEPDCEILYKVSARYAPGSDSAIRWDDPAIGIAWPLPAGVSPALSAKDRDARDLAAYADVFGYDGNPLEPTDD